MRRFVLLCVMIGIGWSLIPLMPHSTAAEYSLEQTRSLLQKGLTVYEIDQELLRLADQEKEIAALIEHVEDDIVKQAALADNKKKHMGKVLRAYYMGKRTSLWMLLFQSKDFSDAIMTFQFLQKIYKADQRAIDQYATARLRLSELRADLLATQQEMQEIRREFLAQRERLVSIQTEIDIELAAQPHAEVIKQQMDDLNRDWQTKGLPAFEMYLQAMADAMEHLPDYLSQHKESLIMNSLTEYTFLMSDQQLKRFLNEHDPIFKNVAFTFSDHRMIIEGTQNEMELTLTGHYVIVNEPVHALMFQIDQLQFNGFELPESRNKALQQNYDLSFYPGQIAAFLRATNVTIDKGVLTIRLKLNLS